MKNLFKNKKLFIILAIAIMSFCMIGITACKKKVEQINITRSNAPQTVYVLGSDLNLSDGKLTVVIKGEKSEIALDDPEISISGYDKNTLGEQILKVTYQEQETILKVTVVPRMVAAKYEGKYFVGEPFNVEKGEFNITNDDGTNFVVPMDDETITVSGFTSEAANANLPLTATYEKDSVKYSVDFNVSVHTIETVEFKAPNKKFYNNHETALDVSGGYISVKCEEFSRYEELTADMVTGFDLSQATLAHRDTPLTQTLTVSYLGQTKTYDIQIKFSDLSLIKKRASEMKTLQWTSGELPSECDGEMGENALEAMRVYFAMSDAEMSNIPEGDIDYIAKVATVYGLSKWQAAFATYKDAFYLENGTRLCWDCSNFEKTQAAYQNILNRDPVLYTDGATLIQLREKFQDMVIYEEDTIGTTLAPVYEPDTIDAFSEQLKLMIDLHLALKDVPDNWTLDVLKASYAENIHNAWVLLRETEYKATAHRTLYYLASNWRANNDYFEILYAYYYDAQDFSKINDFKDLRLPGELETMYSIILTVRNDIVYMQNAALMESTNSLYAYELALEQRDKILASNDEMIKDLYERLEFDYLMGDGSGGYTLLTFDELLNQFRCTPFGYVYNFNAYLGVAAVENLWNDFTEVLDKVGSKKDYFESEEFAQDAEDLLKAYVALTPKQQFGFMTLIQPYYMPTANGRYPLYAWENTGEGYHNQFTYIIYTYYEKALPESTHEIFNELMAASEALSNLQITVYISTFLERMENVSELCTRVSKNYPGDWAKFNDVAGWLLSEYQVIEEKFAGLRETNGTYTPETLSEEEEAKFITLLEATSEAYAMMMMYSSNPNLAVAFYATMEKVISLSDELLASKDPRILRAYYYDEKSIPNVKMPDGQLVTFGGTMDYLIWGLLDLYTNALTGTSYLKVGNLMYDAYQRINIKEFLAEAGYVFHTYVYMQLLPKADPEYKYFDEEKMTSIMDAFHNDLNDEQRYFFLVLDNQYRVYQNSVMRFAKECNTEIATVVEQLVKVENIYIYYKQNPDGEAEGQTYKEMLQSEYAQLLRDYAALAELKNAETPSEEKLSAEEDFNKYFGSLLQFYKTECEKL